MPESIILLFLPDILNLNNLIFISQRTRSLENKMEEDNSSDEVILKLPSYSRPTSPRACVISPRQSGVQFRSHSNGPSPRQSGHSPRQGMVSSRQGAHSPRSASAHSPRQRCLSPRRNMENTPTINTRHSGSRNSGSFQNESVSESCEKSSTSDKHSPSTKSSEMTVDEESQETPQNKQETKRLGKASCSTDKEEVKMDEDEGMLSSLFSTT